MTTETTISPSLSMIGKTFEKMTMATINTLGINSTPSTIIQTLSNSSGIMLSNITNVAIEPVSNILQTITPFTTLDRVDYNNTKKATSSKPEIMKLEIVLLVLFTLIFVIGIFGNGLVFFYFNVVKKTKRTIPETLFSYLAIVDLLASFINPVIYSYFIITRYHWKLGQHLCQATSLGTIFSTMSGGIFVIIALDRERGIVYPFKNHYRPRMIKLCVFAAAIYAFFMNFHYALSLQIYRGSCLVGNVEAKSFWIPSIISFLIQDFTCIFVFTFTNVRIFKHLKSKGASMILGALWEKRKRDNRRVIRLLCVLGAVFFCLTLPRDIFLMVHIISTVLGKHSRLTYILFAINGCVKVLHTANSCVNVFIYYVMHKGFKKFINQCFCCLFNRKSSDQSEFSTSVMDGSPKSERKESGNLDKRHINDVVGQKRSRVKRMDFQGEQINKQGARRTLLNNNNNNSSQEYNSNDNNVAENHPLVNLEQTQENSDSE